MSKEATKIAEGLRTLINGLEGKSKGEDALAVAIAAKRISELCSLSAAANKEEANKEYRRLTANEDLSKIKKLKVMDAYLTVYTKPKSYTWPDKVTDLESKLKKAKKAAQDNGTAVAKEAEVDMAKDTIFGVSASFELPEDLTGISDEVLKGLSSADVTTHTT